MERKVDEILAALGVQSSRGDTISTDKVRQLALELEDEEDSDADG